MLRKIKVYGKLRQILGQSTFEADLHNVGQAFSFFYNNFPHVQKDILCNNYKIWSGDKLITEDKLSMSGEKEIRIIPVATGSGFLAPFIAPVFGGAVSSVIGGIVGGGIGIILGLFGIFLIQIATKIDNLFSMPAITIAFSSSMLVGVIAGVYPARNASKLEPADTLRYE